MKNTVKRLVMLFVLSAVFTANAFALPPEVRFDMLKVELSEQLINEDYASAVKAINELKGLGVNLPASMDYFEGKALMGSGRPDEAYRMLESYVTREGKSGKFYSKAVKLLVESKKLVKESNARKAAKLISQLIDMIRDLGAHNIVSEYPWSSSGRCMLEQKFPDYGTRVVNLSSANYIIKSGYYRDTFFITLDDKLGSNSIKEIRENGYESTWYTMTIFKGRVEESGHAINLFPNLKSIFNDINNVCKSR